GLGESGVGRKQLVSRLPHQSRRLRRGASSVEPGGSKRAIEQAVEVRHLLAARSLRGLVIHAASSESASVRDSKSWSTRTYSSSIDPSLKIISSQRALRSVSDGWRSTRSWRWCLVGR